MLDRDTVVTHRRGKPVTVSMKAHGVELVLEFADLSGEGEVLGVRVVPDTTGLTPAALRKIGAQFPVFADYARAAIQMKHADATRALATLRAAGRTARGLDPDFYRLIAHQYQALIGAGEPHPIKALGELNHATISAASRWVKEARRQGLL